MTHKWTVAELRARAAEFRALGMLTSAAYYEGGADELECKQRVTATCTPDLASFIDPTGALQRAGLLTIPTT